MFTWSDFIYGQNFIDIILRRRFLSMKIENEKIIEFVSEIIVKISIKLTESVYINNYNYSLLNSYSYGNDCISNEKTIMKMDKNIVKIAENANMTSKYNTTIFKLRYVENSHRIH